MLESCYDLDTSDRVALTALCMEYVWRIDHGHAQTIPELFAEDGVWHGPWGLLTGKAELIQGWNERSKNPVRTRHLISNLRFSRQPDGTVRGWIAYTFFKADPGERALPVPQHVGEHVDIYVKDPDGRWRFKSRRVEVTFAETPFP